MSEVGPLPSEASSVTVIRDASGRYFDSFVVEVEPTPLPANGKALGIDMGLASLAVTSDDEKMSQRNLKHKQKGSNRSDRPSQEEAPKAPHGSRQWCPLR